MAKFRHYELALLNPAFGSPLVKGLITLERLRELRVSGSTPKHLFFQLKSIFHMLESLGSARIEGNHTTLADYVESKESEAVSGDQERLEIVNIERSLEFVEENISPGNDITEHFIRELHALTVRNLDPAKEGSKEPGAYRASGVRIAGSSHLPPDAVLVPGYMQELVLFINKQDDSQYDLMKTALAHHRFGWIHPFSNGNGRVVRLLTYALLIKYGFNMMAAGRVLNPTAIFCNDRNQYYSMLGRADTGTTEGLEEWCAYMVDGILVELSKLEKLANHDYLLHNILIPSINRVESRFEISADESKILKTTARTDTVKSSDLEPSVPHLTGPQRTYLIRKLVNDKYLEPINPQARQYHLNLLNRNLLRSVIKALCDEGFVPDTIINP